MQIVQPKGQISFRPVRDSDRDFLMSLYASTRAWERQHTTWSDSEWAAFLTGQFDAQDRHYRMTFLGAAFLIVQLDGADIGRLYLDRQDECLRIVEITLTPEKRGIGIGTDILRSLMNEAHGGKVPIRMSVEQSNPALALYLRHGFRPKGNVQDRIELEWLPETGPREI